MLGRCRVNVSRLPPRWHTRPVSGKRPLGGGTLSAGICDSRWPRLPTLCPREAPFVKQYPPPLAPIILSFSRVFSVRCVHFEGAARCDQLSLKKSCSPGVVTFLKRSGGPQRRPRSPPLSPAILPLLSKQISPYVTDLETQRLCHVSM